ncbi:tail fiber protein [Salmonella enterica]|nr:tail fiber protein [Salmonella enterica]
MEDCFIKNLGLGLGSALPVGVPVPWPLTTPPTGWMKCNGSRFSLTGYPALAAVFPSGVLPDLRGEFIRGWDDGRGVDAGRAIMTTQEDAIQNITGEVGFIQYFGETHHSGALFPGGAQNITNVDPGGDTRAQSVFFDASRSVRTASENRPRNIAFNYIVRAA